MPDLGDFDDDEMADLDEEFAGGEDATASDAGAATDPAAPDADDDQVTEDDDAAPAASATDEIDEQTASDDGDADTTADGFQGLDVDAASPSGLGVLVAGEGMTVGAEPELTAYVTADHRDDVRVGQYFTVPYPDGEQLFLRADALRYAQQFASDDATEIQAQRALAADGVDEADYKFLMDLDPVAIVDGDGRRVPDRIPKPNAPLDRPGDETLIKTGLDIPESGVFLGHLAVNGELVRTTASPPTVDYRLRNSYGAANPLIFRHLLIAGGTGSGKSHTAKNVLRQFADARYEVDEGDATAERQTAIVVFDPQNEYAQMHDDNPDVGDDDRRRWETEGVTHGGHDDTVALVPDVADRRYDANHGADQVAFSVPFGMVRSNAWLLAGGSLNENQQRGLRTLLDDYFDDASDPSYVGFSDFLDDPARREAYDERGTIHEATYDSLISRIADNPTFDRVFDQPADPITAPEMVKRLVKPGRIAVVPTYHLTDSRAEEVVVLALAEMLVGDKLSTGGRSRVKETPLILAMDEAHEFLAGAETAQGRRIRGRFAEAAKQGRKERLGLFLITQDPGDIADPVFKQINTKIALNIADEAAVDSLNLPSSLSRRVPYLERGEMAVYSPDNSQPVELVGLEHCVTRHGD